MTKANTAPIKWSQGSDSLYITIALADVKDESIKLEDESLKFRGKSENKEYEVNIKFLKPVDAEGWTYKVLPRSVQMHVMKKEKEEEEFWPRLLKDKALEKNQVKIDWDRYDEEEGFDTSALEVGNSPLKLKRTSEGSGASDRGGGGDVDNDRKMPAVPGTHAASTAPGTTTTPFSEDDRIFLEVKDGLFDTKSIVGDGFKLSPKEFDPIKLTKCVYRRKHVNTVVGELQNMVGKKQHNRPGLYLQGPAGVGKSVLIYTVTQIAKFHFNWLTVYLPNCKHWRMKELEAMGYFLDRVVDAFSMDCLKQKFSDIWAVLRDSQETVPDPNHYWENTAKKKNMKEKLRKAYNEVVQFLQEDKDTPVLLVFDEVNALWDGDVLFGKTPWEITDFANPRLQHGALLVSGTTDCEFQATIPKGYDRSCVYRLSELQPEETDLMLNTELGIPLRKIREFDEKLWHEIFDACGNIPREVAGFAHVLGGFSSRIDAASEADEPARKKLKVEISTEIQQRREENRTYHRQFVNNVIKKDQEKNVRTLENALFEWCKKYFLTNTLSGQLEILRVPNFIVSNTGLKMRPTTVDASHAYFEWFLEEYENRNDAKFPTLSQNLATIIDSDANGGERGHAFERYLSSKLTLAGQGDLRLPYRLLNEPDTQVHSLPFQVTNRVYASADDPPKNFRNFPVGTLLTHTDSDGGENRIDMIHYTNNRVIYLEATVGNYRTTKLPTMQDNGGRKKLILDAVSKWLGGDVFDVKVDETSSQLSVTYSSDYMTRSTAARPDPPVVHYVVVTTCPSSVRPSADRKRKYNWIKICFLDDLVQSGIIPANFKDSILEAQAADAR